MRRIIENQRAYDYATSVFVTLGLHGREPGLERAAVSRQARDGRQRGSQRDGRRARRPEIRRQCHRRGHPLSWMHVTALRTAENTGKLGQFPESKRIFLNGGRYFEPGDLLVQKDLAQTLERIAQHGAKDFYEGETAHRLADAMASNGG